MSVQSLEGWNDPGGCLPTEGQARTKALRQDAAWCIGRRGQRPLWLEQNEKGGGGGSEQRAVFAKTGEQNCAIKMGRVLVPQAPHPLAISLSP